MGADAGDRIAWVYEDATARRAAWLHPVGGMTRSAKRFGAPVARARRVVAYAMRTGLARVFVDAEVASRIALEIRIRGAFGLSRVAVAPVVGEPGLIRRCATNPFDVIFRLAEHGGACAFMTPPSLFAKSPRTAPHCSGGRESATWRGGGRRRRSARSASARFRCRRRLGRSASAEAVACRSTTTR